MLIRESSPPDRDEILAIINEAAHAYRGIIPDDRWHEPYMPRREFENEIASGVNFWIAEENDQLLGVIGLQDKGAVALVRHAYVSSKAQRKGVGTKLLHHIEQLTDKPILIGTWADAAWAIDFYQRNGYSLVDTDEKTRLLKTYWSIPERQIETSVVLAGNQRSAH